jgi:hypothetical protein
VGKLALTSGETSCRRILGKEFLFPLKATDFPALICKRKRPLDLRNMRWCPKAERAGERPCGPNIHGC